MPLTATHDLPMAEAKRIVQDLFQPKPLFYWVDFLLTDSIGWTAFILAVRSPDFSLSQLLVLLTSGLALYRSVLFVHELSHLKKGTFLTFRVAWNLLCGFPLMIPSFLYVGVHTEHHKQRIYGTREDPEYADFGRGKPHRILLFLLTMVIAPAFFLSRFLVLAPISWFIPHSRKPLWEKASHLAVGGRYCRPLPEEREKRSANLQEFLTFSYGATVIALIWEGILPWKTLSLWFLLAIFILFVNALRSLVAHCDLNPPDHVMSLKEQFLDSTDIPGNPLLTPLWAPVGLRYHATHHLFISIPYHNLGEAHRRLMRELPKDCPYPKAYREGFWGTLRELWKKASYKGKEDS